MIKQQYLYDDSEVFCIYHDDFENYPVDQKLNKEINIGNHKLKLIENYCENLESEIEYDEILEGFLECENSKNPYGEYCAYYKEFINFDKFFYKKDDLISNMEIFNEISLFIKEYSNFNLKDNPSSLNNTIIYYPQKIELKFCYDKKISNNLNIKGLNYEYEFVIKFKYKGLIVDAQFLKGNLETIICSKYWDSLDLEIFKKGKLVYLCENLSFIESVNLNMNIIIKEMPIKLKTQKKKIKLIDNNSEIINIGDNNKDGLEWYFHEEYLVKKKIEGEESNKVIFLSKNESNLAFDEFEKIASSNFKEMWIFDPYFVKGNSGGKDKLRDIIKILSKNHQLKKNIVYEIENIGSRKNIVTKEELLNEFDVFWKGLIDRDIKNYNKQFKNLNFKFHGVKEHFHDRFIFLINGNDIKGYMLGTSLNSFGENYSTLIRLDCLDAKKIYIKLMDGVLKNNALMERNL